MSEVRCQYGLCLSKAEGKVRIRDIRDGDRTTTREIPMCKLCAHVMGESLKEGLSAHITPGGAVYMGDLDGTLRSWRPRR